MKMNQDDIRLYSYCSDYLRFAISRVDCRSLDVQCALAAETVFESGEANNIVAVARSAVDGRVVIDCPTDTCWLCVVRSCNDMRLDLEWRQFWCAVCLSIKCIYRSRSAESLLKSMVDVSYQLDTTSILECASVLRALAESEAQILARKPSIWAACVVLVARSAAVQMDDFSAELTRSLHRDHFACDEERAFWFKYWTDAISGDHGILRAVKNTPLGLAGPAAD